MLREYMKDLFDQIVTYKVFLEYKCILNKPEFKIPKIVIGDIGSVYRLGDYNTYLGQAMFALYCEKNDIPFVLPIKEVIKYSSNGGVILTSQKEVHVLSETITDSQIEEDFVRAYGASFNHFKELYGIFGLAHANTGINKDGKPVILDWMGGPVMMGNNLVNWDGDILCSIDDYLK